MSGNQYKADPRQIDFLRFYLDPDSKTYSNALQSALKAGYEQEYAESITSIMPDWLSESIGEKNRLVEKAKKKLDIFLDSEDEKIAQDTTKFVLKTIGKNEGFTEKIENEIKGDLTINVISKIPRPSGDKI
jgi:hypothetical protein